MLKYPKILLISNKYKFKWNFTSVLELNEFNSFDISGKPNMNDSSDKKNKKSKSINENKYDFLYKNEILNRNFIKSFVTKYFYHHLLLHFVQSYN